MCSRQDDPAYLSMQEADMSAPLNRDGVERRRPIDPDDMDDRAGHHPSCCGGCDTCLRVCWGYHGPERRNQALAAKLREKP